MIVAFYAWTKKEKVIAEYTGKTSILEHERKQLKESRAEMKLDNAKISSDMESVNRSTKERISILNEQLSYKDREINRQNRNLNVLIQEYDKLSNRYILSQIELLNLMMPTYEGSTSFLYKIEDLRSLKNEGKIGVVEYISLMDDLLYEIKNGTRK